METRQADLLRDAWDDAFGRGPHWRQALERGRARLAPDAAALLAGVIGEAAG